MKKTLFPALAAIGLLLSACGTLPPSQVTPGSADDGIVLRTQFPVYAPDVPFIQFTIENNSGDMAEYGTPWTLERLEDDGRLDNAPVHAPGRRYLLGYGASVDA